MEPGFRILVVDDDEAAIARARTALSDGFEIDTATSRPSLMKRLDGNHYDLILVEPWRRDNGKTRLQTWLFDANLPAPLLVFSSINDPITTDVRGKIGALDYLVKSDGIYANLANICRRTIRNYRLGNSDLAEKLNGMVLFGPDLTVKAFNSDARQYFLDLTHRELSVGMPANGFLIKEDVAFLQDVVEDAGKNGQEHWSYPVSVDHGGLHWLEINTSLLFGANRQVAGVCLFIQDFTRTKQTQDELQLRETTLWTVINSAPGSILLIDRGGTILTTNKVAASWVGLPMDEIVGTSVYEFDSTMREIGQQSIRQVLQNCQPIVADNFYDGRYLRTHILPVLNGDGAVYQIAIYSVDITREKQVEDIFQKRDIILQAMNFAADQFLRAKSWRDRIKEVLQCWGEAIGSDRAFVYKKDQSESDGSTYTVLFDWDSSGKVPEFLVKKYQKFSLAAIGFPAWDEALMRGEIVQGKQSDGGMEEFNFFEQNHVKSLLHVPVFLDKKYWGFIGFADSNMIREWSTAELDALQTAANIFSAALLRERDEQNRIGLLNALPDLMFQLDHNGVFVDYHPVTSEQRILSPELFQGKQIEQVLPGEVAVLTRQVFEKVKLTGQLQTYQFYLPTGDYLYWEGRMVPSGDGAVAIVRDITETRRFEDMLRQSEKAVSDLYEITSSNVLTFQEKQLALLQMGCQRFDMENGTILRKTDIGFTVVQIFSPGGVFAPFAHITPRESYSHEIGETGQTLTIEDASTSSWKNHAAYRKHKLRSFMGAPLMVGGKLFGTLGFSSQKSHSQAFTEAEKRFLHLMAQWIGLEFERQQYLVQLQENAREISIKNLELENARDEALEVSRLKSEFLATMSHEIRTPMNAIMGMTELLLESKMDPVQREYAESGHDSARLLLSLLNNVLDFSKIEAGKLVLEQIAFDPHKVLYDAVAMFGLQALQKKIRLDAFVAPQIPAHLKGDPIRLRQVVSNLVGNAIKFTDHGHVVVWCDVFSTTPQSVELIVRVQDTGIGLSESARTQIFQPFTQADGSMNRRYGGTGLGLAIAKHLVEKMDGTIGVDGEIGKGSTFWFTAKFARVDDQEPGPDKTAMIISPQDRFLVYDGLKEGRDLWQRYLENWTKTFDLVETPGQVVDHLKMAIDGSTIYSCCLMDYDGLQQAGDKVFSEIMDLVKAGNFSLILLMGSEKRLRGQNHPPPELNKGRLTRPFSRSTVEKLLDTVLREDGKLTQETAASNPSNPPEREAAPLTDKLIMVAEDNLANQYLAAIQMQHLGYRVVTVSTGARAVDELARHYGDFGLVFMDVQMPEMDGYEAARLIRRGEKVSGGHIPIVAMTANVLHDDRVACLEAGMDDYVAKPVLLDDLHKVFTRFFQPARANLETEPVKIVVDDLDQVLDERILADLRSLNQPGKPDFLKQLTDLFLEDSKLLMDQIRSASEAGEWESLRKLVHSLKGISSNLGAARLSKVCGQVETCLRNSQPLAQDWQVSLSKEYNLACEALKQVSMDNNEIPEV